MTSTAHTMAAANGETVTQGHADYCRTHGHATWTIDGWDREVCPRCGEVTTTGRTVELQRIVARIAPDLTVRQVGELARQLQAEGYTVTLERPALSEYGDLAQPGDRTSLEG